MEGVTGSAGRTVHLPADIVAAFTGRAVRLEVAPQLHLNTEIRFHLATELHQFCAALLDGEPATGNALVAAWLEDQWYHLHLTRKLGVAKDYLRGRYIEHGEARFGLLASSHDRDLVGFGMTNDYRSDQAGATRALVKRQRGRT